MALSGLIRRLFPKGRILITERHPKNERYLAAHLKRHGLAAIHADSLEAAKALLEKRKLLGVILDHEFRSDPEHTGLDLAHYVRREKPEELRALPLFLVADIETATLQEYEYLKINRYFDTTQDHVGYVVDEMSPYFIERD